MVSYDDITISYDGIKRYPCSLNETGWPRCADDSGNNYGGAYGVGQALKSLNLGSGVGKGTDLVGFTALLSGYRYTSLVYSGLGSNLYLWSSSESSAANAWRRHLSSTYSSVRRTANSKALGFSVRCLRDSDDTSDFTDPRDGNVYKCVKIGKQVWMKENLKYLPQINLVEDDSTTEPMYYVYGNTSDDVNVARELANYKTHGVLYNWPAAMVSAPEGWHVPTDEELNELEVFVFNLIYKDITYDGYSVVVDNVYDYNYIDGEGKKQVNYNKEVQDDIKVDDNTSRKLNITRIVSDEINISEKFNKTITRVIRDVIKVGDKAYRAIENIVKDVIAIGDKTFKTLSEVVRDTININEITFKSAIFIRKVIDKIQINETIKRCKNGIQLIWEYVINKPKTIWEDEDKPKTIWEDEDKPNRCK